jgi:hypothetical protein
MRLLGLIRGPDEAGNMLVLPTAARYAATYDKGEQETKPTTTKAKPKAVTIPMGLK